MGTVTVILRRMVTRNPWRPTGSTRRTWLASRVSFQQHGFNVSIHKPRVSRANVPLVFGYLLGMSHSTYFITAAVAGAEPDKDFLACLDYYAKMLKASILVTPMVGLKKDDVIDPIFASPRYKLAEDDRILGEHIGIRHWGKAEQVNPLTGIDGLVPRGMSHVIPSPKQYFRTVARAHGRPEVLLTTGACTKPNYRMGTTLGRRAVLQHTIGAVIVEVGLDGYFHARHIRFKGGKGFTDLGKRVEKFGKGGLRSFNVRAEAIIYGDWHTGVKSTDPICRQQNFDMANLYAPRVAVLHDIMDGYTINHHELENTVLQSKLADEGKTLKGEFAEVAAELKGFCDQMPRDCKTVVVRSNHDEFAERWVLDGGYVKDRLNAHYGHNLWLLARDGKDIFTEAVLANGALPKVKFLKRQESFRVLDWELGSHGDKGVNGSKGNTTSVEKLAGADSHVVVGHQHSPQVFRGAIVVGTTTYLPTGTDPIPYTASNPSTWLHANAVIWPDGSAQLLVMLDERGCKWSYTV